MTVDELPSASSGSSGYYFSRTGANSGWIQTNSWQDSGLSCGTSHTYTVKYRNGDGVETETLSTTKATTDCGGSGIPAGAFMPPQAPAGGFKVAINNGATTTNNRMVSLTLTAGTDVQNMALSSTADFAGSSQEAFAATKTWNLCPSTTTDCPAGSKTVYARFYTSYGQPSSVVSASINFQPQAATGPTSAGQTGNNLATSFRSGDLVNDHGTIYLISGSSKIGFATMNAFQGLGYILSNVISGDTSAYPTGQTVLTSASQSHPQGSWVLSGRTVYYFSARGPIGIPTWEIFVSNGGQSRLIVKANGADLAAIDSAPVMIMEVSDQRVSH
ncbi:MAG: hypothetical protein ACE15E_23990 [Acidobacteriota bacterium]